MDIVFIKANVFLFDKILKESLKKEQFWLLNAYKGIICEAKPDGFKLISFINNTILL
jgi:aromatic ring-opening dioxygenase LigB subunit